MKKITFVFIAMTFLSLNAQTLEGVWKMSPQAGALSVGPNQGDGSWWSNSEADVTTRSCFFDDEYVFNADGTFTNNVGSQTWVEGWQGGSDACGTAVAPHNGSNAATWAFNSLDNTVTLTGQGAYLGLAKVYNGGELTSPNNAPASITYIVTSITSSLMTIDISIGAVWWRFVMQKQVATSPLEGTWKMAPQAGSLGVGPTQGDTSWWTNSLADVTTRACYFDDEYVFSADGTFSNVLGSQSWIEGWQGGSDACGTPVAPHNGSNSATYSYSSGSGTLTLNGIGAYLGLAKVYNGGELTTPNNAPASITYLVNSISSSQITLDISIGGGWWRFVLQKQGTATCTDGIQNGDETGIDCGGANCQPCASPPTVAAPTPPARPTADVVSIFSDAYTNISVNEWGPNWGPFSARINDFPVESNPTKLMDVASGQVFAGIDFAPSQFDATSFTTFHLDYWISDPIPVGQVMSIKLSNHDGGMGETSAVEFVPPSLLTNQWVSLDIPLDSFTAASAPTNLSRNAIAQIVLTAGRADTNVPVKIYMDNIYFHKNTLGINQSEKYSMTIHPNPAKDNLYISSQFIINEAKIYNYLGQEVYSKSLNSNNNDLNISGLNSGVYIVKVQVNGNEISKKFIKE